ncbi:TPA: Spaf_1101 family AAA-like ATPase [Listeria innocua]|nr:AAA family ATPase [Listeria innocua]EHD9219159.1 AAA family ATPase [Listeria innocua]EHF3594785.1 AAA family ATPase [Listeria innocua]EHF3597747.1 AAA family ATPase [Listeria innocua]EHF3603851.1 AAA family ATPase [Listeria innocua]EHF3612656.1 AAA family ATPase [Listeria innocua]
MIEAIDRESKKKGSEGAVFNKTVFHIHTPASHDFGLFAKNDTDKITNEQLFNKLLDDGFPLKKNIHSIEGLNEVNSNNVFDNGIELALFCLQANKLSVNNVKMALITDHNTLSGVSKMVEACKINKRFLNNKCPQILAGIEISCSDKHHVVVILNNKDMDMMQKAEDWLTNYIISDDGTYLPSLLVIEAFVEIGAIAYIAHFNTSDLFKKPKFLSGLYIDKLFSTKKMEIIGLSNMDSKLAIEEKLSNYTKRKFHFILDEDSHTLEELCTKPFWIKAQSLDFNAIKYALNDFDNSISFCERQMPSIYIKSLYIEGKTFIKPSNKKNKGVVFTFSPRMNSFIGGRGSGKSTVLNTIEFLITQYIESEHIFDSVLPQGDLCLCCVFEGETYYITSLNAEDEDNQRFRNNYFYKESRLEYKKVSETQKRNEVFGRIEVWKKCRDNGYYEKITRKKAILDKMFTRKFSVNNLVSSAQDSDNINQFIINMIELDRILKKKIKLSTIDTKKWFEIKKAFQSIELKLNSHRDKYLSTINEYNKRNNNSVRLIYQQVAVENFVYAWENTMYLNKLNATKDFHNYNISLGEVVNYLRDLSKKINPFNVIIKFHEWKFDELDQISNITDFLMSRNKTLDNNLIDVNIPANKIKLFKELRKRINQSFSYMIDELERFYSHVDRWSLEFNINNRTGHDNRNPDFRTITELSLGQKVVAMLNFILSFSEFEGDDSPLIIDQPEDNLDNQYIYNNLVGLFKNLKQNRQVIIASHNSTIVVNSSTELVYVMDSDANNGWIQTSGFCKEKVVLNKIINTLEGGQIAFSNKSELYSSVTNKK